MRHRPPPGTGMKVKGWRWRLGPGGKRGLAFLPPACTWPGGRLGRLGLAVRRPAGVNVRLAIWRAAMTWPAVTLTALSFSVPAPGRLLTVTDCRVSPSLSGSVNGKSLLVNVYGVPSVVVTVWFAVVGAIGV